MRTNGAGCLAESGRQSEWWVVREERISQDRPRVITWERETGSLGAAVAMKEEEVVVFL